VLQESPPPPQKVKNVLATKSDFLYVGVRKRNCRMKLMKEYLPKFKPEDCLIYEVTGGREGFYETGVVTKIEFDGDNMNWTYTVTAVRGNAVNRFLEEDIRYVLREDEWIDAEIS